MRLTETETVGRLHRKTTTTVAVRRPRIYLVAIPESLALPTKGRTLAKPESLRDYTVATLYTLTAIYKTS